jgi:putative nucleotidyltransferase with HDIG domain
MSTVQSDQEQSFSLSDLVAQVKDLPPMPAVIMKAMEAAQDPDVPIRTLQLLISQDQALSAKILRIVNSAMFALRREVSTVSHAVSVLGINTVKSVIMAASVERVFQSSKDLGAKLMSDHSWGTALAARAIAKRTNYENVEEALICGLMHDIGKPVMMQNLKARYSEIASEVYKGTTNFHQQELLAFGFSHAHAGALLARKWNFPPQLAEAVGYHHNPISAPVHKQLACIINLGNLMMISHGIGFEKSKNMILENQPSAEFLKLNGPVLATISSEVEATMQATAALRS